MLLAHPNLMVVQLEKMLEGTEWVKVLYAGENGDHYILGKIKEGDICTHIAYGLPAKDKNQAPPLGLEKYCQWLPLNPNDENSEGYFVMYQNSKSAIRRNQSPYSCHPRACWKS